MILVVDECNNNYIEKIVSPQKNSRKRLSECNKINLYHYFY